mgnify:CR=1 FL=1
MVSVRARGVAGATRLVRRRVPAISARAAATSSLLVWAWPCRPQPPFGCLGEEHPRPVGNARITRGLGNEPGEFRDHRELLVPVESAGVGEHLHPDMRVAAIHVGQHAGGDLVHESCGVLPKHWDVRDLFDAHDGRGDRLGECHADRRRCPRSQ